MLCYLKTTNKTAVLSRRNVDSTADNDMQETNGNLCHKRPVLYEKDLTHKPLWKQTVSLVN